MMSRVGVIVLLQNQLIQINKPCYIINSKFTFVCIGLIDMKGKKILSRKQYGYYIEGHKRGVTYRINSGFITLSKDVNPNIDFVGTKCDIIPALNQQLYILQKYLDLFYTN